MYPNSENVFLLFFISPPVISVLPSELYKPNDRSEWISNIGFFMSPHETGPVINI